MEISLETFAANFQQEVLLKVESEDTQMLKEDAFTDLMIEYLCDHGELDDAQVCSQRGYGWRVSGYGFSMDEECLDLLISRYSGSVPPESLSKTEAQKELKRLVTFYSQSLIEGFAAQLEEASPVYDLIQQIHDLAFSGSLSRVRLFLLTDCITRLNVLEDVEGIEVNGVNIPISAQVWDIERLYRCWSSGRQRESIEVDFVDLFGKPLSCLTMPDDNNSSYYTYLALFPGDMLYRVYELYGPRLLERNVRSFLQVKGSVNQAIRRTIKEEPGMFLAFNNGISATAEDVDLVQSPDTGAGIRSIKDFQIVNGGQTTASIYHAVNRDKATVDNLYVQMKLTVIKDRESMDEIVPRISESANTQNRIQMADFSANHPYHRQLEEHSRTIWAPSPSGLDKQTRWFYERARGQYADACVRAGTPAKRKIFEDQHPPKQKFTKVDLAKYENSWLQYPHIVSLGAQKNFMRFMTQLKSSTVKPDQEYFEDLIAKAILFKNTDKIVKAQKYGGYVANVVTYTIAWLRMDAEKRELSIDLKKIWQKQDLSEQLKKSIITVSRCVFDGIVASAGSGNVQEWCKKEACWDKVKAIDISLPEEHYAELVSLKLLAEQKSASGQKKINDGSVQIMNRLKKLDQTIWYIILMKNNEQKFLTPTQEKLAVILMNSKVKKEQGPLALEILDTCRHHGWDPEK